MKKPLTIPDEPQPRNITRADLVDDRGLRLGSRWPDEDGISNASSSAEKGEGSQSRVSDAPSQGVRRSGKEVAGIVGA
jgi:hypothetical protein